MLQNASAIKGYGVVANYGRIGTVSDILFDDGRWSVRWLVVDTVDWLSGRKILLPPSVMGKLDPEKREFSVELTKKQIKDSPDSDTDQPVSRQMEARIYHHYGWKPYWGYATQIGAYGYLGDAMAERHYLEPDQREETPADTVPSEGDPQLRSIEAVTGYHIHARDGEIGHVEDFLVEDGDWHIPYLVVDTKNWWPGKKVLISPRSADHIDWAGKLVNLNVGRQKVKDSQPERGIHHVDRLRKQFDSHYDDVRKAVGLRDERRARG